AAETHRAKLHGDGTEWRDFSRALTVIRTQDWRAGGVRGRPAERFQPHGSDKKKTNAKRKTDPGNFVNPAATGRPPATRIGVVSTVEILTGVLRNGPRCD